MTPPKDDRVHTSPDRHYRRKIRALKGESVFQVVIEQTDLLVTAEKPLEREVSAIVRQVRGELKAYMLLHPEFAPSLVPVDAPQDAPDVVLRMVNAGRKCQVGPMAAVAGTIAQIVAESLVNVSPNIIVENGGDIYMYSTKERVVGLMPYPEENLSLGIRLQADEFPLSLCSSSARIGHSLSFGQADLVAVRSKDASLADAAATYLANILKTRKDLGKLIGKARELSKIGIDGVFACLKEDVAVWGKMELTVIE